MRKRGNMKLHKFNLDRDDSQQRQLSEHLVNLSYHGKASEWIIATLIASIPTGTPQVPKKDSAGTQHVPTVLPDKVTIEHKVTEHTDVVEVEPKQTAQDAQVEVKIVPKLRTTGSLPSRNIGWSKDQAMGKKSSGKRVTHDVDDVDF